METSSIISVYTDGSSRGNPGPGGAGIVLMSGTFRRELGIYLGKVTNNIAELMAIKIALEKIKKKEYTVYLYTDSEYAIGVLSGRYKIRKNIKLIGEIRDLMSAFKDLKFLKVEGHSGVLENERADKLASNAAKKRESVGCLT